MDIHAINASVPHHKQNNLQENKRIGTASTACTTATAGTSSKRTSLHTPAAAATEAAVKSVTSISVTVLGESTVGTELAAIGTHCIAARFTVAAKGKHTQKPTKSAFVLINTFTQRD